MDKTEIKIEFIKICKAWSALGNGTCKVCPFWGDGKIDSSPCNSAKSVYTQKMLKYSTRHLRNISRTSTRSNSNEQ